VRHRGIVLVGSAAWRPNRSVGLAVGRRSRWRVTRFGSRGRGGAVWTAVWVPSPIVRLTGGRSLR